MYENHTEIQNIILQAKNTTIEIYINTTRTFSQAKTMIDQLCVFIQHVSNISDIYEIYNKLLRVLR